MLTRKLLDLSATFGAEWVNWVLVAVSIVATAVVIDRLLLVLRTPERFDALRAAIEGHLRRGEIDLARRAVERDTLVRNVLRSGLDLVAAGERRVDPVEQVMLGTLAAERARYEARLAVLTTIGNIAPLVGLLGTVIGIVDAFYLLGRSGTVQAANNAEIMSAIGEALVTTGLGILVAVPAVVLFNVFRNHVSVRLKQSEALMRELVAALPRLAPSPGERA